MTEKHRKIMFGAAFAVFMLFCVAVGWFVGKPMIQLAQEPEKFRQWVDAFGPWSRVAYVAMVVLQVVVALIPGEPLELAGGYAFGALEGTLLAMAGIIIGSVMVFVLVRRFGVKLVEVFFSRDRIQQFAFLKNPRKTKVIVFILMMIPGTPKDFLSYFAGLTKLRLREWLLIVAVARIPSVVGSTISGGAAGAENYALAAVIMVLTLCVSGLGILYYRRICRRQREEEQQEQTMKKAG